MQDHQKCRSQQRDTRQRGTRMQGWTTRDYFGLVISIFAATHTCYFPVNARIIIAIVPQSMSYKVC